VNFRNPYSSPSVTEFWQRWHISLSTWFRDYLYVPLGGNRVSIVLWMRNILIVFLVSGLWHGANWTFVVWGGIHAVMFIIERLALNRIGWESAPRCLRVTITFFVVCIAWIFFRSGSVQHAQTIIRNIFFKWGDMERVLWPIGQRVYLLFGLIVALELFQRWQKQALFDEWADSLRTPVRWALYLFLTALLLYVGDYKEREFIYFQF